MVGGAPPYVMEPPDAVMVNAAVATVTHHRHS